MSGKLDVKKYLLRVIIACWIALVVCLVIKLFGANLFEIVYKNDTFNTVCTYADNHLWANYLISAVYCFVSLYFFTLAILQERKFELWQLSIVIITVLVGTAVKIWNAKVGLVFDVWQFIGMPILFLGKQWKSYWKILVANVLLIVFQLISMIAKNIDISTPLGESVLIGTIFSIDVLIMIILYYAFVNVIKVNKENKEKQNG